MVQLSLSHTVWNTVLIRYTQLYTGWLIRVFGSNRAWIWVRLGCRTSMYNKARIYSVKQGLLRLEHDLLPNFIGLFNSSKCVLVQSCTIKHDFYSIYLTFTWFTYGPADFCSSYAQIYMCVCVCFDVNLLKLMVWLYNFSTFQRINTNITVIKTMADATSDRKELEIMKRLIDIETVYSSSRPCLTVLEHVWFVLN